MQRSNKSRSNQSLPLPEAEKVRTLGIVIFPGFELLDAYGPLEMWGNLKGQVKVVTVAREKARSPPTKGPRPSPSLALRIVRRSI